MKHRFLYSLLGFLFFVHLTSGQKLYAQTAQADSLKEVMLTVEPSSKPFLLHELFLAVYPTDPQQALEYAQSALELAQKHENPQAEAHALSDIGMVNHVLGNYSLAMKHYVQASNIFEEQELKNEQAMVLNRMGQVHFDQPSPLKALELYMRASSLQTDQKGKGTTHNLMGNAYQAMNHYTNAIKEYKAALAIFEQLDLIKEVALTQNNMGAILLLTGKQKEATLLLNRALNTQKELNDQYDLISTNYNLSLLYLAQNKLERALSFAKQSQQIAQRYQAKQALMKAAKTLATIYEEMGSYQSAYRYIKQHASIQDSLFNEQRLKQINQMQTNYDISKKESEIDLLTKNTIIQEKEDKIQKQWIAMLLGGIIALIVITVILVWNSQRLKRKSNLLLQQHENVQLTQENTHKLSELGKRITSLLTVQEISSADFSQLSELMPADVVGIGIYQPHKRAIVYEGVTELGVKLNRMEVSIADKTKLSSWCFLNKESILINDIDLEYHRYIEKPPQMLGSSRETFSVIYVPLIGSKNNLGVLTIQAFKDHAFTQYHLDIASNFALYTAIALENAQAFQELRDAVDKLLNTQEELLQARKMASIGEFTKGIAHELNNPINFVLNGAELMHARIQELQELAKAYSKLDPLIPKERIYEIQRFKELIEFDFMETDLDTLLEDIKEGARRSAKIVKGLQMFSAHDTGEMKYTDIHMSLDDSIALLGNQIRYKSIHIIKDYEETGQVYLNPIEINQVFVNLLTNAIQSINGNGKIALQTRLLGEQVKISVKDNGCGIPHDLQEKIFDPFFTTRDTGEGTGLGLAIVYSVVKKHNGKVEVNSQPAEGTEFVIYLPKNHVD